MAAFEDAAPSPDYRGYIVATETCWLEICSLFVALWWRLSSRLGLLQDAEGLADRYRPVVGYQLAVGGRDVDLGSRIIQLLQQSTPKLQF